MYACKFSALVSYRIVRTADRFLASQQRVSVPHDDSRHSLLEKQTALYGRVVRFQQDALARRKTWSTPIRIYVTWSGSECFFIGLHRERYKLYCYLMHTHSSYLRKKTHLSFTYQCFSSALSGWLLLENSLLLAFLYEHTELTRSIQVPR